MPIVQQILTNAAATLLGLLPYLIVGVLLGEALRLTPAARWLEQLCRQRPVISILSSAILGMASPLCTYGTVPVVLELLRNGVSVAPLVTFLASSSLMNPQLLVMTWGGLGPGLAVARIFAVLALGIFLGGVLHVLPRHRLVPKVLESKGAVSAPKARVFSIRRYLSRAWHSFEYVGFYVLVGVLLGAAVEVVVPGRWIVTLFGAGGWWQLLLAALLGVPLYACGGGTIPLVQSLLDQGMAPGAALAFLIAGPATRITPLMALATLLRPSAVIAYIALLIVYAVFAGACAGLLF